MWEFPKSGTPYWDPIQQWILLVWESMLGRPAIFVDPHVGTVGVQWGAWGLGRFRFGWAQGLACSWSTSAGPRNPHDNRNPSATSTGHARRRRKDALHGEAIAWRCRNTAKRQGTSSIAWQARRENDTMNRILAHG